MVVLARLGKPHGLEGWQRLYSHCDPADAILGYPTLHVRLPDQGWHPGLECCSHGQQLLARLPGVSSPEQARPWVHADVAVHRDALPALPDGQHYWCDLVGLSVLNHHDQVLGQITELFNNGPHDVLVVQGRDGVLLIPHVPTVVMAVDLDARVVRVHWELSWSVP